MLLYFNMLLRIYNLFLCVGFLKIYNFFIYIYINFNICISKSTGHFYKKNLNFYFIFRSFNLIKPSFKSLTAVGFLLNINILNINIFMHNNQ